MFGSYFRRITLFVLTNLAVVFLIGVLGRIFGLDQLLFQAGYNPVGLLVMSALFGGVGSVVSLLLSKRMALWSTGARIIDRPQGREEEALLAAVQRQAKAAGIKPPDFAIYEADEPNAFATGAFRNSALVAISTGLLHRMDRREVEAVLAHEISHVANGDMVTMALLQGVVNTFVIFLSRTAGFLVDKLVFRTERSRSRSRSRGPGPGYRITTMVAELAFGLLASLIVRAYSRRREFRADAGAAGLVGAPAMVGALRALAGAPSGGLNPDMAAFGIQGGGFKSLLSTHPRIEDRIAALQQLPRGSA